VYRESIGQGLRVGQHAVSPQALYTPLYVVQSAARALVVHSDCLRVPLA
jgi:hypothetical protein